MAGGAALQPVIAAIRGFFDYIEFRCVHCLASIRMNVPIVPISRIGANSVHLIPLKPTSNLAAANPMIMTVRRFIKLLAVTRSGISNENITAPDMMHPRNSQSKREIVASVS